MKAKERFEYIKVDGFWYIYDTLTGEGSNEMFIYKKEAVEFATKTVKENPNKYFDYFPIPARGCNYHDYLPKGEKGKMVQITNEAIKKAKIDWYLNELKKLEK